VAISPSARKERDANVWAEEDVFMAVAAFGGLFKSDKNLNSNQT
jgi:hypothetical protein